MRRRIAAALVLALSLLSVSVTACGGGSDESKAPAAKGKPVADPSKPVDLTLWTGFTERELGVIKHVVARFEKAHPNIHVKTVGGINDDKIVASIRGGNAPDVAHSFSSDNTGPFCSTGAWVDLASYMQRDGVEESIFPEAPRYYTEFEGKRCALPMLADVYGLYYNKALFAKAGLSGPPKTVSELTEYAKKLTQRNSDGSLKVVGFNPVMGFYENQPSHFAPAFDARWTDGDGKSSLAASPGWSDMLRWQKELVDWYGYDKLVRFQSSAGDEWSASNAFETGKVAMNLDGEWRVAFIADQHPKLKYGTAPLPVSDDHPDLYGSGYVTGSIIGIPKTSENKDAAWQLVKYLATDDEALAALSNGIRNVPTTTTSLKSPMLEPDENFKTFLDIFAHPKTTTSPITLAGSAQQERLQTFVNQWQAGRADDLDAGLRKTDEQIDAQLENASGQQVP